VPFILRISRPRQIRENNGSRIWWAGRPAVFLQQRYPASPGVRLPSVALKSHCRADEGTGVSRCTLSMTMATIPYCGSEPGLTRWSQGVKNWQSASSSAVSSETSCLHYLLPDKRDVSVTGRLHHARTFEPLKSRTVKFRHSFLPYCLDHHI